MLKSVLLAEIAGWTAAHFRRASLLLVAGVVIAYQAIGTLGEWVLLGDFRAAVPGFSHRAAGMLLQIFGGWAFIKFVIRK